MPKTERLPEIIVFAGPNGSGEINGNQNRKGSPALYQR